MTRSTGRNAAALACLALLGGCGGDDGDEGRFEGERANVARVVEQLQDAARQGDGARICGQLFTRNLAISVARASRRPCAQEVTSNLGTGTTFEVLDVQVRPSSAVAQIRDETERRSSLVFLREGGGWRIARIGRIGA